MCQQRESNVLKIETNMWTKGNWLVNQAIVEKQFLYGDIEACIKKKYLTISNWIKLTTSLNALLFIYWKGITNYSSEGRHPLVKSIFTRIFLGWVGTQ